MWAMGFDDFKRKVAPQGIELHKLVTCVSGTDDYTAYMAAYLLEENTTIDVYVEDDHRTTTFYTTILTKTKETQTA